MNNEYDKNYYNLVIIFLDIKLDWSFNLLIIKGAINQKIISSLKKNHVPLLEYKELPDELIKQFHSISFLILDWNLSGMEDIPEATINDNIAFLKELHNVVLTYLS